MRHALARKALASSATLALVALLAPTAAADNLADGTVSDQLLIDDEFITGVSQPTAVAFLPDGRIVVTERTGGVVVRTTDGTLVTAGTFPANSGPGEQGLLNVLPHPDFGNNHLLYFYYSADASAGGSAGDRHRVVTVELGDDNTLDMSTENVLVSGLMGPANHNGGGLSTYGDYLFVGTGDTGSNSNAPPGENVSNYYGTCLTNAQGKLLRVHLDGSIPTDNPLVGQTVTACGGSTGTEPTTTSDSPREDIFAWGFRNAFRVWADPQTGNVWVGNVGEITFEMIQVVPPGGAVHFGWPFREGNKGLPTESCQDIVPNVGDCADAAYVCEQSGGGNTPPDDPDIPNDCDSMTGGLILNDCQWPADFEGRYVFGDYTSDRVWTLPINDTRDDVIGEREDLATLTAGPVGFAENNGALYVVSHAGNGHITRIAPQNPEAACDGTEPPDPIGAGGSSGAGAASGTGAASGSGARPSGAGGAGSAQTPDAGGTGVGAMPGMDTPPSEPMPPTPEAPDPMEPEDPLDPGTPLDPGAPRDPSDPAAPGAPEPAPTDDVPDGDPVDAVPAADEPGSADDDPADDGDAESDDDGGQGGAAGMATSDSSGDDSDCACGVVGKRHTGGLGLGAAALLTLAGFGRRRRFGGAD
jgi:glucose/arabinose dehydrogenase